jgi:lipopolysaccharide exporter
VFHSPSCALLLARGRPDSVVRCHLVYLAVLVPALALLINRFDLLGAAIAVLIAATLSTPAYLWQLKKRVGINVQMFVAATFRPLIAAAMMALLLRMLLPLKTAEATLSISMQIALLFAAIALGALLYIVVLWMLWQLSGRPQGAEQWVLGRLRALLRPT